MSESTRGSSSPPPSNTERERLIEATAGAYRDRDPYGNIVAHPAWHDLAETDREEAFVVAQELRALEALLDPEGLSTTARAVLSRILVFGAPGSR